MTHYNGCVPRRQKTMTEQEIRDLIDARVKEPSVLR